MCLRDRAAGSEERLRELLATLEQPAGEDPGAQVDKTEELRAKWGVNVGDLWQLGEHHRLICGDCTDAAVVARVMGEEKAGLVFTDPPYATFGSSTGKMELGDYNMLKPFWQRLVETIHENTQHGRGAFICCDWRSYPSLFEVVGRTMKPANLIVWNHKAIKLGSQFRPSYELLLYAINQNFKRAWKDKQDGWKIKDRSVSDVWEIRQGEASPGSGREHSSQKPVALVEFAMTHCSDPGDIVTDFFSGSGTTLIACERLGRRCRACEIEPGYVAVALERWHVMTGQTPVLVA